MGILYCKWDESILDDNVKESVSCYKYFWMEIEVIIVNY